MASKACSQEECLSPVQARGMCNKHYLHYRYHNQLDEVAPRPPPQSCARCGEQFQAVSWRKVYCSPRCRSLAHYHYSEASREKQLWQNRLRRYGVTPEQFANLLASQDGCCAICRGDGAERTWHIDHDHTTGHVRGVLCGPCNTMLGHAKENIGTLLAAAEYLITTSQKESSSGLV